MNNNRNSFTDAASAVSAEKQNNHATAVECADTAHAATCLWGLLLQLMRSPSFLQRQACLAIRPAPDSLRLKILIAITGASGSIYAQRLLDNLDPSAHEVHLVLSRYAQAVISEELPGGLRVPEGVIQHSLKSMNAPFASGSNPCDAMAIVPCSMGTLGRIAHGYSDNVLLRAADVTLKEGRKLILVPRETPLNLIHVKNMELLLLAGATLIPANPSFYTRPDSIQQLADTVVARILDQMDLPQTLAPRWQEEQE